MKQMSDDDLKHNYLERRRRDEAVQPVDTQGASARTGARLSYLLSAEASEAEIVALHEDLCTCGSCGVADAEHRTECPLHEPSYKRGQVAAALVACDVGAEKMTQVLHVLAHMVKP